MNDTEEIVEEWVRHFFSTMDDEAPRIGDDSGESPFGVKIIFDGYGYDEETDQENADENSWSFAVFVHKDSLTQEFPEHDYAWGFIVHRPKEEVCIYAWYDLNEDRVDVIPFDDSSTSTDMDKEFVKDLIVKIWQRDNPNVHV